MEGFRAQPQKAYKVVGVVFALLLGLYFVYQIEQVVLLFLLTLLFAIVLSGPVNYLARLGLPKGLGILVVLGSLVLALWLASRALTPIIQDQAQRFVRDAPTLLSELQGFATSLQSAFGLQDTANLNPQDLFERARGFLSGNVTSAIEVGRSIAEAVSMGVVAFILTIYLVVQPSRLVNGFVSLFPAKQRGRVEEILGEMYHAVQKWVLGQLSAMLIIAVLTSIALYIIGIPYALFIGALSGILAFIPLVGALVSVFPPVLLALATNPISAIWVVLAYILVHQIEAHLVQPLVMSRAVALHPVVVVLAILIMGRLFGLVGLLLAVPLVAALSVLMHELWVARMDRMGTDPRPSASEREKTPEKSSLLRRASNALRRT